MTDLHSTIIESNIFYYTIKTLFVIEINIFYDRCNFNHYRMCYFVLMVKNK